MVEYCKKGIGKYLDANNPKSKKILDRINYYYSIMQDDERKWIKKIIAGTSNVGEKILFEQKEGYFCKNDCISVSKSYNIDEVCDCLFHELGHYVDCHIKYYKTSENAIDIFIKEFERKNITVEQYCRTHSYIAHKDQNGLIFDSLGVYYAVDVIALGCRGHDMTYTGKSRSARELFAEFFAAKFMNETEILLFFKEEFPKTYYYLNTKINNLIK